MTTLTPADTLACVVAAGACLYFAYRVVMWLANRVIDGVSEMCRFEHE